VTSGTDGMFRMTVDRRFRDMAGFRRHAILLFPAFAVLGGLKLAWLVAPFAVNHLFVYKGFLAVHAVCYLGGLLCWFVGNIWGRNERFAFVMTFNMMVMVSLCMVRAARCLALCQRVTELADQADSHPALQPPTLAAHRGALQVSHGAAGGARRGLARPDACHPGALPRA